MHITAGVFVNDDESGLHEDIWKWLDQLAPAGVNYKHHRTGEDNGDACFVAILRCVLTYKSRLRALLGSTPRPCGADDGRTRSLFQWAAGASS